MASVRCRPWGYRGHEGAKAARCSIWSGALRLSWPGRKRMAKDELRLVSVARAVHTILFTSFAAGTAQVTLR